MRRISWIECIRKRSRDNSKTRSIRSRSEVGKNGVSIALPGNVAKAPYDASDSLCGLFDVALVLSSSGREISPSRAISSRLLA